jgi:hypothetical protein
MERERERERERASEMKKEVRDQPATATMHPNRAFPILCRQKGDHFRGFKPFT